ncbi:aldo/keto reductase [Nonomuraea sp. WAC 01424]|uniref:aldo/keto reductase n=1 Tax=Nonomuraea sp. WAC 01424 TaxID=2203200 RepID=UPI000F798263|nr:aldo/keto reductase [Nonomuraea sp. WAC 01424]RSN04918.1 aldo/keto reductase [Nonomuraea sp. WAC 01424]
MITRRLGTADVSAVGLGAMPLSIEDRIDRARAIATVHAALDAGITLIDTADSYHWHAGELGHNEELLAEALAARPGDGVLVATKGGRGRPGDGTWTVDGRPAHIRAACEGSLRRLRVPEIGLYQLHKPDPAVPWAESVGALRDLLDAGLVVAAGVSNVTSDQIREARDILGDSLVSVQNRFSPQHRDSLPELRLCDRLGIAFLPWSPLGGIARSALDGPGSAPPRTPFHEVAEERGTTPQQVCLAWHLAQSEHVIPIPGATRRESVRASAQATSLPLTREELRRLDTFGS